MCSFGSSNQSAPTSQASTQTTTASPYAMAMYNQAWSGAQKTAQRPFQPYSYDPSAFAAPMNSTQLSAVNNLYGQQNAGQQYFEAAPGMAYNAGNTNAAGLVPQYMSPYLDSVAASTMGWLGQQQAQDRNRLNGQIAANGQWGNDRSGIERAILAGQQNMATSSAMSNLYNQGYNTALGAAQTDLSRQLQASQQLSGAGLSGANALLGAGTVGQQTQQKGLDALYQQYMMQQQYPFQVAQFLSSIAAGLGPGYGSTTSGYQNNLQPLSYFGNPLSDPAAKVGADGSEPEVIGETHDGQDIYRYRVVNPDTGEVGPVQIGLMADEVERRRPDAIGDYKGLRTVDYERATDDAARMGGGVMGRGDYAPGGIVPQFNMPTARLDSPTLSYARPQERKQSGLGEMAKDALSLIKTSEGLYDEGKGLYNWFGDRKILNGAPAEIPQGYELNKRASGGGVYQPSGEVEMRHGPGEFEMPVAKLDAPSLSYGSNSQEEGGGLGGALKTAAGLAGTAKTLVDIGTTVGPMLMALSDRRVKTGVRPKHATAGGVDPEEVNDDFLSRVFQQESGGKQFDRNGNVIVSPKGAVGLAQIMPGTMPEAARYAGVQPSMDRLRSDPEYNRSLGRAYLKHQLEAFGGDKEMALAAYNAGPLRVERAMAKAHLNGGDWKNYLPRETQAYIPAIMGRGLAPSRAMAYAPNEGRPSNAGIDAIETGSTAKGLAPAEDTAPAQGLSGFIRGKPATGLGEKALDFATSERFLVPLLTGLGAMASSGSRYLAPAILQGLGAGAGAYMQVPKVQAETAEAAERARTQAEETKARHEMAPKIRAETQRQLIDNFKSSIYTTPYGNFVFLENGMPVSQADYMEMWRSGQQPRTLGMVPKDAEKLVQPSSGQTANTSAPSTPQDVPQQEPQKVDVPNDIYDKVSIDAARKEQRVAMNGGPLAENAAERTKAYSNYVTGEATGARENAPSVKELAGTLSDAYSRHGYDEPGFKATFRADLGNLANTLYHALGGDPDVNLSELKNSSDVVNKISTLLATQRSAAGGQHAYAALEAIKAAIPNLEMDKNAGADLTAQLMTLQQRAIDRDAHMRAYMKDSNGLAGDAADDFTKKSVSRYQKEQKILADLMLRRSGAIKVMMSGSGVTPEQIEEKIKKWYPDAPSGMWRYFAPIR